MSYFQQRGAGPHSHIHSLADGYVHGEKTEKQLKVLNGLIMAGCGSVVHLVGPRRTGRDAFIEALVAKINCPVRRVCLSALENRAFDLERLLRSTCRVRFCEQTRIAQGEVVSMTHDKLVLKTQDMESAFGIGLKMRAEMEKRRVQIRDVIKIYREAGLIMRLGTSAAYAVENSLYGSAPVPEGECCQVEERITPLILDELDSINSSGDLNEKLLGVIETSKDIRDEVDRKVKEWVSTGKATVERGVLIIEQPNTISKEILKRILSFKEAIYKPTIIFVCDSEVACLDSETLKLTLDRRNTEIARKVIAVRASYYGIELPDDITEFYLGLAESAGLSYALSIMQAAAGANAQTLEQVQQVSSLFIKPQ